MSFTSPWLLTATGVALTVLTLAACGSSSPRGFHSARQAYSVREVESAFFDHGLTLSRPAAQPFRGVVALDHGHGTDEVAVWVIGPSGASLYAPLRRFQRSTLHGNVAVGFPLAETGAVRAALGELH